MAVKNENFIFRRSHRRLSWYSSLAIVPLFFTLLSALVVWIFDTSMAAFILEQITELPSWVLAVLWILLPLISIILSKKGKERGTLYNLRRWNTFIYWLSLAMLSVATLLGIVVNFL